MFNNYLAIIIIGYSGLVLIFFPFLLFESKELGYLLLVTSIIWAINKYYYLSLAQSLYKLDKQGKESIKVLSHQDISDLALSASTIRIQINYHQINRKLLHSILALEFCQKKIMVLITNCSSLEGGLGTFEQKILFDLLYELVDSQFSVRVSSTNSFQTMIFLDNTSLLLIPFKGCGFLCLRVGAYAHNRQEFDQIWENSKQLSDS